MKSTPNSGRARRQLSFANLPYHGKCFYLDIKNSSLKTRLSRRILDLGGQIENFLSKDINLLITEKIEEKGASKTGFQISVGKQNVPLSRGKHVTSFVVGCFAMTINTYCTLPGNKSMFASE